jgi:DNA-binding HxlR family transcriptional regulator
MELTLKRTRMDDDVCAVARALDIIGDWWSLLIVRDALSGLRRFGEFQRSLGAAKNILTVRLKALTAQGILEQVPASDGSAYLEYVVTEKGRALAPVIVALGQWGDSFLFEPGEARSLPVDAQSRRPLKVQIQAADGRDVGLDQVVVTRPDGLAPAA